MTNPPEEFFRDRARLLDWMGHNKTVPPDGSHGQLAGIDLSNLDLRHSKFAAAHLEKSSLRAAVLPGAQLTNAHLADAVLEEANLDTANFQHAHLRGAKLSKAHIRSANFESADLSGTTAVEADLTEANLLGARLQDADFQRAKLTRATLKGVQLGGCDLRGADLYGAELTNTAWRGAKIDAKTKLHSTVWRPEHDAPNDGADELSMPWLRRYVLNWERIRAVGQLPLFAGSYLLLTASLASATAIAWLNESAVVQTLRYPVPMPQRLVSLLLGSTLLAVGSTIFELFCPARVKEFSRTRWVEELRRSGVLYVSDSLQHPALMGVASIFLAVGGILVGWVFLDRLFSALALAAAALRHVE